MEMMSRKQFFLGCCFDILRLFKEIVKLMFSRIAKSQYQLIFQHLGLVIDLVFFQLLVIEKPTKSAKGKILRKESLEKSIQKMRRKKRN